MGLDIVLFLQSNIVFHVNLNSFQSLAVDFVKYIANNFILPTKNCKAFFMAIKKPTVHLVLHCGLNELLLGISSET